MKLKTRIERLEGALGTEETRVSFERDATGRYVSAGLLGARTFTRGSDEDEGAFLCRVFGTQVVRKPAMEMSDYELLVILAASDPQAASELASNGTISDRTVEALA